MTAGMAHRIEVRTMSREVRKVPANWQHPADGHYSNGEVRYDPLFDGATFEAKAAEWDNSAAQWARGEFPTDADEACRALSFEQWDGPRPDPAHYMPLWADSERTYFMMYETTSEGTPISPAFATKEELARWLVDQNESFYAGQGLSYEEWLRVCNGEGIDIALVPSGEASRKL